ncbi:hypothetical protein GH714_037687 [Hevea brasiliensis]|uniref:GTP diphosphokinase n=1 Tax=Hevea brasiliensis TaxID=3981 RepID=A0A6A6LW35_HEVBR|nr:hypothetical protein GH714_037687 [Hevea brasiliensis]
MHLWQVKFQVKIASGFLPKDIIIEEANNVRATWIVMDRCFARHLTFRLSRTDCNLSLVSDDEEATVNCLPANEAPEGSTARDIAGNPKFPNLRNGSISVQIVSDCNSLPAVNSECQPCSPFLPKSICKESENQTISEPEPCGESESPKGAISHETICVQRSKQDTMSTKINFLLGQPLQLTWEVILEITQGFKSRIWNGLNRNYTTYYGYMEDDQSIVLVKRFNGNSGSILEAEMNASLFLHHKNILSMIGYHRSEHEIVLVFPVATEGTLDRHISVSLECVNICKLSKGDGSGRYDCSVLSCAWKAPRILTGFLASTAHPPQSSSFLSGRNGRRNQFKSKCEVFDIGSCHSIEAFGSSLLGRLIKSGMLHVAGQRWQFFCSSSISSGAFNEFSAETLWEVLRPTISYLSPKELELVQNALKLAFEAHDGQKRRSGEPFIIHPVEVARILGELELDWESIAAGLLHDTVEDTNVVTFERIEEEFGPTVRRIVEGETKVSKLGKLKCKNESDSVKDVKADDLRQMFLAMTEEVRVIIVKLADRLHNMRTLSHMPPHKQSSIAMETLQVFAPLAKLLGMYQIKSELENLSFMYTNPEDYAKVRRRVSDLYKDHEKELVELRIVIKPKPCVGVGPLCTPQQMKDYIATPKPNGYQSLHTTVIPFLYESMFRLEVQIRTEEMNLIAERGIAAHYSGRVFVTGLVGHAMPNGRSSRGKTVCLNNANIALRIGWLNAIREWQEEFVGNMSSREFVETITRDLLGSRVFVFTPRGEALSSKSAFQRHKQWLQHAKTHSARHKIMKFLREQATLSAAEITADTLNDFIADSEEESEVEELPGMMAEVTSALAAVGIAICSCVAEIDRGRGMAVMLFHIEGNLDNLVKVCSSVDLILGVLGWSTVAAGQAQWKTPNFLNAN